MNLKKYYHIPSETLEAIKSCVLVRSNLVLILRYFFGISLNYYSVHLVLSGRADVSREIFDAFCELSALLSTPVEKEAFWSANRLVSLIEKKEIRRRMRELDVDPLFLFTCVRYLYRVDLRWYQFFSFFFGFRALSDDAIVAATVTLKKVEGRA